MSSDTYNDHKTYTKKSYAVSSDAEERSELEHDRTLRIEESKSEIASKSLHARPTRDPKENYSKEHVRLVMTKPDPKVKRIYVCLIDNSGSNRAISNHIKHSSNYLRVNLELIDPEAQFAFIYFSDHCDEEQWWQPIDWIFPSSEGEKILTSTLFHVVDVHGGDEPEAHECAFWDACDLNFGKAEKKHLILISDVTGHNMGMEKTERDDGCINQRDWHKSLGRVDETYSTFEMIGCGNDLHVAKLQEKFISLYHPELLAKNLISLSYLKDPLHRLGIVPNAFLFLVARHGGPQVVEAFLARLYEKWIDDPIFGKDTDMRAKEAILRFSKFIPSQREDVIQMMSRILVTKTDEIDKILEKDKISI
jgi:hypothetical protein